MFLKSADFVTIELILELANVTSQTPIKTNGHTRLLDFSAETMTLTLPPRSCSAGHHLELELTASRGKESRHFATTATVQEAVTPPLEPNEPPDDLVQIRMVQFNSSEWKSMRAFLQGEGDAVSDLFDRMKGNE